MRWQDVEEVRKLEDRNPFEALAHGYQNSDPCMVAEFNGRCIAMGGINPHTKKEDAGILWVLSDSELENHVHYKVRQAKEFIDEGLKTYAKLVNTISADTQTDTIEWLKHLGASFSLDICKPIASEEKLFFEINCQRIQ